jgi:murein DD-endopeptidase MepM/ murein hydrolase activator NlpD
LPLVLGVCVVLLAGPAVAAAPLDVAISARSIQPGELVVLTASAETPLDALSVRALDRSIPAFRVAPSEWRALIGLDLGVREGQHRVSVDARSGSRKLRAEAVLDVRPKVFPTRRLRVDETFVNPPPEVGARITREARLLQRLWSRSASARLWRAGFVPPVPDSAASRFGAKSIFNGQPRSPHSGADFPSAEGTRVAAPSDGQVVLAEDLYFTGRTVVLDHGLGVFSLLAHLSALSVDEGQHVSAGSQIGLVGATGRVTGPHLHWAVRVGGARVDPLSVLAVLGSVPSAISTPAR